MEHLENRSRQTLGLVTIVVRDYDEALAFYVGILGFALVEDTLIAEQNKRWVVVAPQGASESRLLLARAASPEQLARVGQQTGGRVAFFLTTSDFWHDYQRYCRRGVCFVRPPRSEPYGTVAVFRDPYGNLWDLLQATTSPAADEELLARLRRRAPLLWSNPRRAPAAEVLARIAQNHELTRADIDAADALLRRWAPALSCLFPETGANDGIIESPLIDLDDASPVTGVRNTGRALLKADHALPVAGSIKARGGIYEVLAHAEALAARHGRSGVDPRQLLSDEARTLFAEHTIAVGSTGNLGLAIGIMASALGFRTVVHMSRDAKQWKKDRLRARGVDVVEHVGDYASAVAAGREAAATSANTHFVDDENSRQLFLGYAVAALRLERQLDDAGIAVDAAHPLVVHLPCGVGGAPGGITFGLKHVFGDAVRCYFAEPCASPAMLVRMSSPSGPRSVYDIGLDNLSEADGLAVGAASELVFALVGELVEGVYTVADEELFAVLARLEQVRGIRVEPSAAASFLGPRRLHEAGRTDDFAAPATQLFWTTGGAFVPADEYQRFLHRGRELLGEQSTQRT